ncbi:hypothetical protein QTN47_16465 [Danxiaibacter flavus]|uniref:Uncharacterized protein n=1 Tax=Danxiaibacter flavus TaxID=3049108 RepID=A0ABV3ZKX6_9BACT|nr:hypothetical protein QNM32_16475 [Chitinophagaceae bacterium DXS]
MKKLLLSGLVTVAVFGTAITVGHTQKVNSKALASYESYQDTTKKDTSKKDTTRKPDAAQVKQ